MTSEVDGGGGKHHGDNTRQTIIWCDDFRDSRILFYQPAAAAATPSSSLLSCAIVLPGCSRNILITTLVLHHPLSPHLHPRPLHHHRFGFGLCMSVEENATHNNPIIPSIQHNPLQHIILMDNIETEAGGRVRRHWVCLARCYYFNTSRRWLLFAATHHDPTIIFRRW